MEEATYGTFFVERGVAAAALAQLRDGLQFQCVGDSQILIDCLLGRSCTDTPNIIKFVRVAHLALQTLVQNFCIRAPGVTDVAQQVPRSDNSAADAAANRALDYGTFMELRLEAVVAFLEELATCRSSTGLLVSFEGAARGNPGPSASGVCLWWGYYRNGEFLSKGLLIQKGTCLRTGTNNSAESHGLASALKTTLQYHYWLIEQTSQLTRHAER